MHRFVRFARENLPAVIELSRELVECESPSDSPLCVDQFVELLIKRTTDIAEAKTFRVEGFGKHLRLEFHTGMADGRGVLALGHSDTVWPAGTLKQMPFRQAENRLWGPGVLDMKAGLAIFVFAVRALLECGVSFRRPVALLVVSDEEVGSTTSRAITEAEARRSECVLVLEPGSGPSGKLKTARKGVGRYEVNIEGRASHAGLDFETGASAIVEAARQIERIAAFTDLARGITVNPGFIRGGTRSNVVAAETLVEVDVRVPKKEDAEFIDSRLRMLTPIDGRCRITVTGGINRPPMERTPGVAAMFDKARRIGMEMGLELQESSTGGGSDGNFTAALGVPTLDGLGAVGEGAHAASESVFVGRIAERVALLAGLLEAL